MQNSACPKVLVVEDEPDTLAYMARLLKQHGYPVVTAADGIEALDQVRAHRPAIVVSDWMMRGMDGLELCRRLRADPETGTLYFVMITALAERKQRLEALGAGADEFLTKPLDVEELLARLRTAARVVGMERALAERYAVQAERDHLRHAVSAMEQVLGVVGHELRTPLAGIRAMSEFLLTDGARQTPEFDSFLRGIQESSIRMGDTVNDLLEAARLNSGRAKWNWSTFDVGKTCRAAVEGMRPLIDAGRVGLSLDVAPDRLSMLGDADAIGRLVTNLLSNAHKHTARGSIAVTVRAVDEREAACRRVRIDVRDTGCGIPEEIRARLGEAFALNSGVIGSNYVAGSGLGLAICKGIVAAHGGSIVVDSAPGRGTVITSVLRADLSGPATPADAAGQRC